MTTFADLYHPALGNVHIAVPNDPTALALYESHGWVLSAGGGPDPTPIDLTVGLGDLRYAKLGDIPTAGTPTGAALRAAFVRPRDLLRAVPLIPLHPSPPTVTLGAAGAPSQIVGGVAIPFSSPVLRWTACDGVESPAAWYQIGRTPTSALYDRGYPFSVDFEIDTADFEIHLAGTNADRSYKLWVDGQPLTFDTQVGPGASGTGHRLRLNFGTRKPRHVRIMTDAGIVDLTVGPTDTVWAPTRPLYSRRVYFLGDSFTGVSNAGYGLNSYVFKLCDYFGWEPMMGGQAGTGYINDSGGSGQTRTSFQARAATDVAPTHPDMVIVYGGTNDVGFTPSAVGAAAAATYAKLAEVLPGVPVYVFGVQYPTGAANSARDAIDAVISAAATAAPNVVAFRSVKSWVTGTGNAGGPAGNGNADVVTSSDGLHPTAAGHAYIAGRMAREIVPVYAPGT